MHFWKFKMSEKYFLVLYNGSLAQTMLPGVRSGKCKAFVKSWKVTFSVLLFQCRCMPVPKISAAGLLAIFHISSSKKKLPELIRVATSNYNDCDDKTDDKWLIG